MNSRFWIAGVYENYTVAGLGSDFELTPGVRYGKSKEFVTASSLLGDVHVIHDPIYHMPSAGAFMEFGLDMTQAYLHQQLLQEVCISQTRDTLLMHSPVDIYAEYLMNFPHRVKLIDDLVKTSSYKTSKIYYLSAAAQFGHHIPDEREEKYHSIVKRLLHDMKIKFVMPYSYEDVPRLINDYRLVVRGRDTGVGVIATDS